MNHCIRASSAEVAQKDSKYLHWLFLPRQKQQRKASEKFIVSSETLKFEINIFKVGPLLNMKLKDK